ncbi:Polymerase/histidinol phosphatase-like protein [Vararia minispora EC-137]|uniref:Polymerase/histidinol phosphatase-like protein n=1 Tax=Vararia minispora EC-137 TaxID=1314806 RepID=A0ACB8QZJ1_9AGAM|nr:Polymerase/histidinol phosphatase-like protein [Vararia minispora EC-137]
MPQSHHSHSGQFCKHATGSLEDVVLEAIRRGFDTFCLTEHVPRYRTDDLYPEEKDTSLEELAQQFDSFIVEAHRLKNQYASKIQLLVGLETEHITFMDLGRLSDLLHRYEGRVDLLVGSVHHVCGVPIDFDRPTFERCLACITLPSPIDGVSPERSRMETYLESYFDAQYEVLKRFHPEIVGHVDLCRLYMPTLDFRSYGSAWEKLKRNVLFAVGYGALFEANAAALRKGWDASYPGRDVLEFILEHGGRLALSDDSHGPHAVGLNYIRMREYLLGAGVREIWKLEQSVDPNAGGRYSRAVRVEGEWWKHPFWEELL